MGSGGIHVRINSLEHVIVSDSFGSRPCENPEFSSVRRANVAETHHEVVCRHIRGVESLGRFIGHAEKPVSEAPGKRWSAVFCGQKRASGPYRLHERGGPQDVHHAFEIVRKYVKTHLGAHVL